MNETTIYNKLVKNYWLTKLANQEIDMAVGVIEPQKQTCQTARLPLPPDLVDRIGRLANRNPLMEHAVYLTFYGVLLFRYFRPGTVLIASPTLELPSAESCDKHLIFYSLAGIDDQLSLKQVLKDTLREVQESMKHQQFDYAELMGNFRRKFERSEQELLQAGFAYGHTNGEVSELSQANIQLRVQMDGAAPAVDVTLHNTGFREGFAEQLAAHYQHVLMGVHNLDQMVGELPLLPPADIHQLLYGWNNTQVAYPEVPAIQALIEAQVRRSPEAVALVFDEQLLTYEALNASANQVAACLRVRYHIQPNDRIAVAVDRTETMPMLLLAILKAGAAYVPIDKTYPASRLQYLLSDSEARLLITDDSALFADKISSGCELADWRAIQQGASTFSAANLSFVNTASDLAYLIYTSGSTGQPKGVQITHGNTIAFLQWAQSEFQQSPFDVVFAGTSYCFDLSVYELFFTLSVGKRIRLLRSNTEIGTYLQEEKQVLLNTVPSVVDTLLKDQVDLSAVTVLNMAGEPIPYWVKAGLDCGRMEVRNLYGPSEDTTYSSCYRLNNQDTLIPIGKPISNTQFYVLDPAYRLVPPGIVGQIAIGGAGLAKGYWNKPDLTAERFIDNPMVPGQRLYLTGDLGRWLPDGNLDFVGRNDHQVKIRGYRIELGEIENVLVQAESVENAVVVARQDAEGANYLVAYMTGCSSVDTEAIQDRVKRLLPAYMVPAYFLVLDQLPLNANGKIDRNALPDPKVTQQQVYVAPTTPVQEQLVDIWQEVLGRQRIGIRDNFFDLGGHSLKAMRIVSSIYKRFHTKIALRAIFSNPTVETLAEIITASEKSQYEAIPAIATQAHYAVSHAQKRLWILDQAEQSRLAYHIGQTYQFDSGLNKKAFRWALEQLVERHEILRTTFLLVEGEVRQKIHAAKEHPFTSHYFDLRGRANGEQIVQFHVAQDAATPFDLENDSLLRASLFQLTDDNYLFLFSMHHIITDGWSMAVFFRELLHLYNAYTTPDALTSLPPLRIQYKDYAAWQNTQLLSDGLNNHRQYWQKKFESAVPVLELTTDFPRLATKTYSGDDVSLFIDRQLLDGLNALGKRSNTNLFVLLIAAVKALLYRYTGQQDIVIGSPKAGREHEDLVNQIGFYVDTLALRTVFSENDSFAQLLETVKETVWEAFEHQAYPFDLMIDELDLAKDRSRSPLFDVFAMFVNADEKESDQLLGEAKADGVQYGSRTTVSKFDLTFNFVQMSEGLRIVTVYNTDLFTRERISRLISHYQRLLEAVVTDEQVPLCRLEIMSAEEKNHLLVELNQTQADYARHMTIHELVSLQVKKSPNATALVWEQQTVTYEELDRQANQLAHYLRERCAVQSGDLVGILVERTPWMVISMLGILKAGAAYVPIDRSYPQERIRYILADSAVKIVLLDGPSPVPLNEATGIILNESLLADYSSDSPAVTGQPDSLAYVIYTSGSTGQPKGVEIRHRNAVSFISWAQTEFASSVFETVFAVTSYCFDLSIFELFFTLSIGKQIRLLKSGLEISTYLQEEKQVLLNTVPSVVDALLKEQVDLSAVTVLNMAGEPIPYSVKAGLDCARMEVRNLYGPSEDTTYSSCYRLNNQDMLIPIGKPIANTRFYLLDANLNLVPMGLAGQICIAGDGVARGYLNKEELTGQKFIDNPFEEGERLYLTGDLGRWLPDGNVEFLGRIDHQVKIRGFRIELGEIENVLLKAEAVNDVVVVAREDAEGSKYLVAYFVGTDVPSDVLRQHTGSFVPGYMVPAYFVYLAQFPLTPNGKIDRKALPDPISDAYRSKRETTAPRTETETRLARIWSEILGKETIGIQDSFFEIGGHSLKAMRVLASVHKEFETKITLRDFFDFPTIEALARVIEKTAKTLFEPIKLVEPQAYYEVSQSVKRMWIVEQLDQGSATYNMPSAYSLHGSINTSALKAAFQSLFERHEILRTTFVLVDGEPYQKIHPIEAYPFHYETIDLSATTEQDRITKELAQQEAHTGFDLASGPLFRVKLIKLGDTEHLLLVTMDHIISDGWSLDVIFHDVLALFEAYSQGLPNPLAPLRIQHKDYAAWQNKQLMDNRLGGHCDYWLSRFAGELPLLTIALDFPRPPAKTFRGASVSTVISPAYAAQLKQLSLAQGGSLYIVLLATVKALLHRYSGQQDIIVGTPIAGRNHPDLENQIGFFVNTLAMRTQFSTSDSFENLLAAVKDTVLGAFEHQVYPFDQLVENLNLAQDPSRSPLFDVMVLLENASAVSAENINAQRTSENVTVKNFSLHTEVSKFDLMFSFRETPEEIILSINYNTDLFTRTRLEQMLNHYQVLIQAVLTNQEIALNELNLFSAEEEQALLTHLANSPAQVRSVGEQKRLVRPSTPNGSVPANATERKLLRLWQDLLGQHVTNVEDNFFELGGHSLKATRLLSMIYREFPAAKIGLKDIFDYPTIRQLVEVLYENTTKKKAILPLNQRVPENPDLFLIPPIIGSSTIYRPLALQLDGLLTCYGLQYKGFDYDEPFETSIESMANAFAGDITKVHREGIIYLLGYSMGALVAHELTGLLEQRGYSVELILLDRLVPQAYQLANPNNAQFAAFVETEADYWLREVSLPNPERIKRLLLHNYQLMQSYQPSHTIEANVVALEANQPRRETGMQGWADYTTGRFEHEYLEGDHFDMLSADNVAIIAQLIKSTAVGMESQMASA